MKIGFAVQGSTDRAFLHGLQRRWCRDVELLPGPFRGSTGLSLRRELAKICRDFRLKGCDILVFLSDADVPDWRGVQRAEVGRLPQEMRGLAVYGMADRNIECWLCADPHYAAQETGRDAKEFQVDDPKGAFEAAMGITRDDKREEEIAQYVAKAPLARWLENSRSFEDFYDQLWGVSKQKGCAIENLRESPTS